MFISNTNLTGKIDKLCINKYGIPEIILMENAANAACERIMNIINGQTSHYENSSLDFKYDNYNVIVLCGVGNNGGDGFAISRLLVNRGFDVSIVVVGNVDKMTPSAYTNYNIVQKMGVEIFDFNKTDIVDILDTQSGKTVIIDSIFGVGLNRDIVSRYGELIERVNYYSSKYKNFTVISIDIPSGLDGNIGEIKGVCINADYTISFEYYKNAFLRYDLEEVVGKVFVEQIGIPITVYEELKILPEFIDESMINSILFNKKSYLHKGDFGKVCIFAGSKEYSGAAYLSTRAAVRTGSGLTTLVSTKEIENIVVSKFREEMYCPLEDIERVRTLVDKSDGVGFGPGLKVNQDNINILKKLIIGRKKIVVDADGINMLKQLFKENIDLSNCVITPHLAEFSRISGYELDDIQKNRILFAEKFAKEKNMIVVLKGKNTIITDGKKTVVNTTGNYSMANGGMGDVLTGIITSLVGQGYGLFNASCIGVYLHGMCADILFENQEVVNASDILEILPKAIRLLKK